MGSIIDKVNISKGMCPRLSQRVKKDIAKQFRKKSIANHRQMLKENHSDAKLSDHMDYIKKVHKTMLGNKRK